MIALDLSALISIKPVSDSGGRSVAGNICLDIALRVSLGRLSISLSAILAECSGCR